jgi:Ca-activated chloride channel family protein
MKAFNTILLSLAALCCATFWSTANHAAGLMTPAGSNLPPLDIREHHVTVVIEDGYAITRVEQVFGNPNSIDLEAIYSFPVPERPRSVNSLSGSTGSRLPAKCSRKSRPWRFMKPRKKPAGKRP